jgi:hypothetical protein
MKYWLYRGAWVAIVTLPVAIISGCVRPLLGVAFLVTALSALSVNGLRAAVASIPLRPADADDPVSPPAISRGLQDMIRGHTIFVGVMSLVFAIAAICTVDRPVRIFATSFAVAALAAGPGTSVHRRMGLRVAAVAVVAGLLLWWLQRGRV